MNPEVMEQTPEERTLRMILGPSYGGPSLGFEDGFFVLYRWLDAPVSMEILAKGYSLKSVVGEYLKREKK